MTTALVAGEGSASRPGRSLPPGKNRYPLYRRLGGPQGRSGQVRKISPPPGFDPWTVQPVGSRYNDGATRPTCLQRAELNKKASFYLKFQLVPLCANFSGFRLFHNMKKSTKQALCHGTRIVARSSITFILRPVRFYDNGMQDIKQVFPFSLWSAFSLCDKHIKGYFRVTVSMRATNTCASPCHVSRDQQSQFRLLCRLTMSN